MTTATPSATSRSTVRGGFRFLAGVAADDVQATASSDWVSRAEGEHRAQAQAVYAELERCMADSGGLDAMCRQHIYQQDKRYFPVFEKVRLAAEPDLPTPSSGIGVDNLLDRPTRRYEVDGIGLSPDGAQRYGMPRPLSTSTIGSSASHYTQCLVTGPYAFSAGMIAVDPATGHSVHGFEDVEAEGRFLATGRTHPDSRTGPIAAQTWVLYRRLLTMLAEADVPASSILCSTVFLSDAGDTADFVRVHDRVFADVAGPALQIVVVDEVGHRGTVVEIEVTASMDPEAEIRRTYEADSAIPSAVRCGELAFLSDVVPEGSAGRLPRSLDEVPGEDAARAREHVAALGEPVAAQVAACVATIRERLQEVGADVGDLGNVTVCVARPVPIAPVADALRECLGGGDPAITVLSSSAVGQAVGASVVMSAVCAGLS